MTSSAVGLSSITQKRKDVKACSWEREMRVGDVNQYCMARDGVITEDWKLEDPSYNTISASICTFGPFSGYIWNSIFSTEKCGDWIRLPLRRLLQLECSMNKFCLWQRTETSVSLSLKETKIVSA